MVEPVMGFFDHVQVGEGRFYHDDIGAFGDVALDLPHGHAPVGRVHLVAAPVAELGRGVGGHAEWTVEGGGVFGGVAHDRHIGIPMVVQGSADGPHLTVHHRRRGHQIRSGLYLGQGCPGQQLQAGVVVHVTVFHDAAVTVVGILAETNVGDDQHIGDIALDYPDRFLDDSLGVVSLGPNSVFLRGQAE